MSDVGATLTAGEERAAAAMAAAREFEPEPAPDPPEPDGPDGGAPDDGREDAGEPPVTALGEGANGRYYFLGPRGAMRMLTFQHLTRAGIASLFDGDTKWLRAACRAYDKDGNPTRGWSHDSARDSLIRMCCAQGRFDPAFRLRGPGAWPASDGGLVLHLGDVLWRVAADGAIAEAASGTVIEGIVYPSYPAEHKPASTPAAAVDAQDLLEFLGRWNWRSPVGAPRLLLGMIGQNWIVGAVRWRAHGWIAGLTSAGKSTLLHGIRALAGPGMRKVSDATEASVRQVLSGDWSARVVELDEVEPEPGTNKVQRLVRLAHVASDGGDVWRGTTGGEAKIYSVHAALLFGSELTPRFLPATASRIAVFDLAPLDLGDRPDEAKASLEAELARLVALGPALYRRMIEGWGRLRRNLAVYDAALARGGYSSRVSDQYGSLLAIAETLLSDVAVDVDTALAVLAGIGLDAIVERDSESGATRCMHRLFSSQTGVRGAAGVYLTVGGLVSRAIEGGSLEDLRALREHGLSLVLPSADCSTFLAWRGDRKRVDEVCLAISNSHEALYRIYAGSDYENGVWPQALRNAPEAVVPKAGLKFGAGPPQRATVLPPSLFWFDDDLAGGALPPEPAGMENFR